jgi:acyl transferase domain-containing protein/NADPH:quinone reductase-like Zn-dependent oxidoreductase/acyl carrier protein
MNAPRASPGSQSGNTSPCATREPLAIIGIGCRFPGGADSPAAFWKLLCDGTDATREVPEDRWLLRAYHDPDPRKLGKMCARRGGFLSQIDRFDPLFFGISPREAAAMDPQHRLLLELAWEALEDGGQVVDRLAGTATGVFIGLSTQDYGNTQAQPSERRPRNPYLALGTTFSIAANRISYLFDLRGPSFVVDTACSSSLVALHLACRSLWQGESTMALVGGVNVILRPETSICFSNSGMLAPDGRCKSFDARADGYARGEGGGVIVLKLLAQALRDNDDVYAVIVGTAVNQDGHTSSITIPNQLAQEAMLREAYRDAGIDPTQVQYVEAHGTGTPTGDPIEANALGTVLGQGRPAENCCWIGSVKTNIGHLEAGAGMAGVIKAALALRQGMIPPNLHFEKPSEQVDFKQLRLRVPQRLQPWPPLKAGRQTRVAGVNSFGFGGTNAHAVLADADGKDEHRGQMPTELNGASVPCPAACPTTALIPLSARSLSALAALAGSYAEWLAAHPDTNFADLCYTLTQRRSHHPHRLAVVVEDPKQLREKLHAFRTADGASGVVVGRAGTVPRVVYVFTGMGPQWWAMGRQLLRDEPVFRQVIEECDDRLRATADWSLLAELTADEARSRIDEPQIAQPALFAIQVGLAALWRSWGIEPAAIVGHSVGEVAAAAVSGALSLEHALLVIYHRSRLQQRTRGQGKMLAVGLAPDEAETLLATWGDAVTLAAVNGPRSITLSGAATPLRDIAHQLEGEGTFCRLLQVDVPYHSPLMDALQEELLASLAHLRPSTPELPLYSTVTGQPVEAAELDADYWWRNVRRPVCFATAITGLLESGYELFLEIGPHPVLAAAIQECALAARRMATVLASLRRPAATARESVSPRAETERGQLLRTLGKLYTMGAPVNWERLAPQGRLLKLPAYPWQREHFWRESEDSRLVRRGQSAGTFRGLLGEVDHHLLGQPIRTANGSHVWHGELDLEFDNSWLLDHRIQGTTVYPGTAYAEMALMAARKLFGGEKLVVEEIEFQRPLVLEPDVARAIETIVEQDHTFVICSRETDGTWVRHATGKIRRDRSDRSLEPNALATFRSRCTGAELTHADWYPQLKEFGFDFGRAFQGVERVWCGKGVALGLIQVREPLAATLDDYLLHPAIIDCCIQIIRAALPVRAGGRLDPGLYVPQRWRRVRLVRPLKEAVRLTDGEATMTRPPQFYCCVRMSDPDSAVHHADFWLLDENGALLAEFQGLFSLDVAERHKSMLINLDDYLYEYRWQLQPRDGSVSESMPRVEEVVEAVQPALALLRNHDEEQRQYHALKPQLDVLCAGYFRQALKDLGWEYPTDQMLSPPAVADELGIVPRFQALFRWILATLAIDGSRAVVADTPTQWRELMLRYPESVAELTLLGRCGSRLADILRGQLDPAELLFPKGVPTALEHLSQDAGGRRIVNRVVQAAVAAIVHKMGPERPLGVLELGAGTGGLTGYVLPVLPTTQTRYLVTDTGPALLPHLAQKFRSFATVEQRTLNPLQDPITQGFEPHSFDLILASDVLGRGEQLAHALPHVKSLLASDGLLIQVCPAEDDRLWALLRFLASDEPLYETDGRPPLAITQYENALTECGFSSITSLATDAGPAVLLAQATELMRETARDGAVDTEVARGAVSLSLSLPHASELPPVASGYWLVFADNGTTGHELAKHMKRHGDRVITVQRGEAYQRQDSDRYQVRADQRVDFQQLFSELKTHVPCVRGIVYLWGVDSDALGSDFPQRTNELGCLSLLHLLQGCTAAAWPEPPRLWIVTCGVQSVGGSLPDVGLAALWGLGRVVMTEHPELRCTQVDLSPQPSRAELRALFRELSGDDLEDEVALRGDRRYVHRLIPVSLAEAVAAGHWVGRAENAGSQQAVDHPYRVEVGTPGLLDSLVLRRFTVPPPGPYQVTIAVHTAALNFKDIAKAVGLLGDASLQDTMSGRQLGLECAGRIVARGEQVTDLQVGDAVIAQVPGCLASRVTVPAALVARKPAHLSFEEAVTIPVAFATAAYALHDLGRMRAGERVLIHAASGGVGLAAVQLAQQVGAEVFATAGSREKREFLHLLGVQHVFDSRSLDFADQVLEQTAGRGVDIVLNSLAGEALTASLSILAPGGRFLELGKRDIEQNSRLGLRPFQNNLAFFAIDLDRLWSARPETTARALTDLMRRAGETIRPLPYRVFPVSRVQEAFRWVAQAKHIGKVVLSFQDPMARPTAPAEETIHFRADATYLITGGLGGFGLATAQWLAERGARHLALLGRSGAASTDAQAAVEALRQAGVQVHVAAVDVANPQALQKVLTDIRRALPPLRGVMHAAMVLDDGRLQQLDAERLHKVLAPKVAGAWNLHRLTADDPLDFLVLFSSVAAVFGNWGQGNYAAANSFLDTLARHRRALGRPALSVSWTAVADVGYVARHAEVREHLNRLGFSGLPSRELLKILGVLLQEGAVQTAVMRLDNLQFGTQLLGALSPRFSQLARTLTSSAASPSGRSASLLELLRTAHGPERTELLRTCLCEQIGKALGIAPGSIDVDQPLTSLGLESLMALELGTRLKKELGIEIPTMKLLRGVTLNSLLHDLQLAAGFGEATKDAQATRRVKQSTAEPQTAAASGAMTSALGRASEKAGEN